MATKSLKTKLMLAIGTGSLMIGGTIAYAVTSERWDGTSDFIGLAGGPARLIARKLTTHVGETTGAWHYHPGYVYNVVAAGTITVEDGCGDVRQYSAGQAFETSDGRVHRAYNLGPEDAVEYNMFVNLGANNATITKFIPNNERRCGPPSTVDECKGGGWEKFDWPTAFAGQGECVTYVNNRPTITLLVPADPLP
jgi:quercetin dioxygenase-like cupin family protein